MRMMKGKLDMKYLKIKEGDGLYLFKDDDNIEYKSVSEMVSSDIYNILLLMGDDNCIEMDEEVTLINNEATKIVYENLLNQFKEFVEEKDIIKKEIDDTFSPLEQKYL